MSGKKIISRFIEHNRALFSNEIEQDPSAPIMLMELNSMHSAHIAYSYLAHEMSVRYGAQIKAYSPRSPKSWLHKLIANFKATLGCEPFVVYRSFGVNEFIKIIPTTIIAAEARLMLKKPVLPIN